MYNDCKTKLLVTIVCIIHLHCDILPVSGIGLKTSEADRGGLSLVVALTVKV